jgi:hypothetical protein
MTFKARLKIRFLRWIVYFKNEYKQVYLKKNTMNEHQKKALDIIQTLFKDKDSNLIYSNISNKRYIEYKNYMVIFNYDIINIIDSHSCYDVQMNKNDMMWMNEEFDKELERRVRSLELYKRENLKTALEKLLENLSDDQKFKK